MAENPQELTGTSLVQRPVAIRGAIAEVPQGPWAGRDEGNIEAELAEMVKSLAQLSGLVIRHVDWNCYEQGFASAVPVILSQIDDKAEEFRKPGRFGDFEGVVVALCRLAPIACVSAPGGERIGYAGMLGQGEFISAEDAEWVEPLARIDEALLRHGVVRLSPDVLNRAIDPSLTIDTNFGDAPFTVFDAWFHWWD